MSSQQSRQRPQGVEHGDKVLIKNSARAPPPGVPRDARSLNDFIASLRRRANFIV